MTRNPLGLSRSYDPLSEEADQTASFGNKFPFLLKHQGDILLTLIQMLIETTLIFNTLKGKYWCRVSKGKFYTISW